MKVVLLAGGFGTRISEESRFKPKPMIEIGNMPILWHIMKEYAHWGFDEFIICAGYKQDVIKEYFANYFLHSSDITFDFSQGDKLVVHQQHVEPWKVTIVDTGLNSMTGGRIREKSKQDVGYINGGYMILEPEIFNYIEGDNTIFERQPLETIANEGELMAYKHNGFWQCMDTMRDREKLQSLWESSNAPWKVWDK